MHLVTAEAEIYIFCYIAVVVRIIYGTPIFKGRHLQSSLKIIYI